MQPSCTEPNPKAQAFPVSFSHSLLFSLSFFFPLSFSFSFPFLFLLFLFLFSSFFSLFVFSLGLGSALLGSVAFFAFFAFFAFSFRFLCFQLLLSLWPLFSASASGSSIYSPLFIFSSISSVHGSVLTLAAMAFSCRHWVRVMVRLSMW